MRTDQWQVIENLVQGNNTETQASLIVDSPWIPPFLGISTEEYITKTDVFMKANLEVISRFPEIIFFPGFWVEMGMAAEPSGFGTPVDYYPDQPPTIHHIIEDIEEVDRLKLPDPRKDGLMPRILKQYKDIQPLVAEQGMDIKIVAARGPMTLASHLMGVTNFLVGLKTDPDKAHELLKLTTQAVKNWLDAQAEVLPGVEGIFVLDDIVGFLGEEDYLEFAHGYFKDIFSIPVKLKALHNDTPNLASFKHLGDMGVNLFNFSHQLPIQDVRSLDGDSIVLMGNIAPVEVLVNGSAEEVETAARECINSNQGNPRFLLSAGGGVSMGTPESSIQGIIAAVKAFNKR